jgi:uncharacterized protein (DUF58 family)
VRFNRRGIHREDEFLFSTAFPFGFLERRAHVRLRREALVYPCLDPQPGFEELAHAVTGEIAAYYRGRGHDFHRIRPYETFESARYVDWKATAHTGELQVREFAREQEPLVEILLDTDVPGSATAWFEAAVDCCAFLAWRLVQKSARLRFRAADFDVAVPETGDIYTILKFLALVSPARGKVPPAPDDENSFQLVFTAAPERFAQGGWSNARIVRPDLLADAARPVAAARAGQNVDHGHR